MGIHFKVSVIINTTLLVPCLELSMVSAIGSSFHLVPLSQWHSPAPLFCDTPLLSSPVNCSGLPYVLPAPVLESVFLRGTLLPFIGEYVRKQDLVSECRLAFIIFSFSFLGEYWQWASLYFYNRLWFEPISFTNCQKNVLFLTFLPLYNLIDTWFILLRIVWVYSISLCLGHPSYFYIIPQNISLPPLTSIPLSQEVAHVVNYFKTHLQCPTVQLKSQIFIKRPLILMPVLGISCTTWSHNKCSGHIMDKRCILTLKKTPNFKHPLTRYTL